MVKRENNKNDILKERKWNSNEFLGGCETGMEKQLKKNRRI